MEKRINKTTIEYRYDKQLAIWMKQALTSQNSSWIIDSETILLSRWWGTLGGLLLCLSVVQRQLCVFPDMHKITKNDEVI